MPKFSFCFNLCVIQSEWGIDCLLVYFDCWRSLGRRRRLRAWCIFHAERHLAKWGCKQGRQRGKVEKKTPGTPNSRSGPFPVSSKSLRKVTGLDSQVVAQIPEHLPRRLFYFTFGGWNFIATVGWFRDSIKFVVCSIVWFEKDAWMACGGVERVVILTKLYRWLWSCAMCFMMTLNMK